MLVNKFNNTAVDNVSLLGSIDFRDVGCIQCYVSGVTEHVVFPLLRLRSVPCNGWLQQFFSLFDSLPEQFDLASKHAFLLLTDHPARVDVEYNGFAHLLPGFNVRLSMSFLDTSSCRMHLSACSNNFCVSTAMGSVLSLPACVFGKIIRALAVDHGKCQAFL